MSLSANNSKKLKQKPKRSEDQPEDLEKLKTIEDQLFIIITKVDNEKVTAQQFKRCFFAAVNAKREAEKKKKEEEKALAKAKKEEEKVKREAEKKKKEAEKALAKAKREEEKKKREEEKAERKRKREEEREIKLKSSANGILSQMEEIPLNDLGNLGQWLNSKKCKDFKYSFKLFLARSKARRNKRRKIKGAVPDNLSDDLNCVSDHTKETELMVE